MHCGIAAPGDRYFSLQGAIILRRRNASSPKETAAGTGGRLAREE